MVELEDTGVWWRQAVVYQVYVRSFGDSNADGVGDLPGVTARLSHLVELGVDAVWLTPFYPSPMADHGYDVSDPMGVDGTFGTLADFDDLLTRAHALGLKVIIDIVPNHTSAAHPWFREALARPDSPARDRYLFRDRKPDGGLPNNWLSEFGGPAWSAEPAGDQVYLHLFAPGQPDLNWRNPEVHAYWERVLRFWLDRGADGFRIDVAHGLYKQRELADNPAVDPQPAGAGADVSAPGTAGAGNAFDQPEVHDVYTRWREICDFYPGDRMLVGEVFLYDLDAVAGYVGPSALHQSFNFLVMRTPFTAAALGRIAADSLLAFAARDTLPTWVLSNHDLIRHATRYGGGEPGRQRALAATCFLLGLPGSPYLYQGEELGCDEVAVPAELRVDPIWIRSEGRQVGRDGCRTPLPWTGAAPGFGFTAGESTWLPFAPDAGYRNVGAQRDDPASILSAYETFLALRRDARGRLAEVVDWLPGLPVTVSGYRRSATDRGADLLVLLNSADAEVDVEVDVELILPGHEPVVVAATKPVAPPHGRLITLPARATVWLTLR